MEISPSKMVEHGYLARNNDEYYNWFVWFLISKFVCFRRLTAGSCLCPCDTWLGTREKCDEGLWNFQCTLQRGSPWRFCVWFTDLDYLRQVLSWDAHSAIWFNWKALWSHCFSLKLFNTCRCSRWRAHFNYSPWFQVKWLGCSKQKSGSQFT